MPMRGYIYRAFRVGGIRFLRIGQYQFSFCIVRRSPSFRRVRRRWYRVSDAWRYGAILS